MQVAGLLPPVLDVDVLIDHAAVERAGPVESAGRDDVGEAVGLHLDQQVADARAIELEDALRVAPLEKLEGRLVVERKVMQVERCVAWRSFDEPDGLGQGRQVSQPEEVHLQEAGLLDVPHLPLGADDLLLLVLVRQTLQGDKVAERPVGDHDPRGVRADVPRGPFEPLCEVEKLVDLGVFVGHPLQRGLFLQRLLDRDVQPGRDQLVDLINPCQRDVQRPADVLDRGLGCHRAEGADLRHVGFAVLLADVLDDLVPPLLAEVDVDVGRLGAVRVEEPLEQQVVFERIRHG